jgi:ubiquinone/menaquinone biosynthesis C-methylase UbiE
MDALPTVEQINLSAYQEVATNFSNSRYKIWPSTMRYLRGVDDNADDVQSVLEVGCGNGKNLSEDFEHIQFEGTDICPNLLKICEDRGYKVKLSDGCDLPYSDNEFDHVFSVAVIHHLSTHDRRVKFIQEMVRVCKPGGRIMFQVWATTSPNFKTSLEVNETEDPLDKYVLFKVVKEGGELDCTNKRFYHFFDEDGFNNLIDAVSEIEGNVCFEKDNHIFEGVVKK